jgi:hypothetical protein
MITKLVALFFALLVIVSAADASQPVARLVCISKPGAIDFNLSYFDLRVRDSQTVAANGNAIGKEVLQPLAVHAALASFESLRKAAGSGSHFDSCVIKTQASNGENIQFNLRNVIVQDVSAIVESATLQLSKSAYVDAILAYGAVQVSAAGGAMDDGGASGESTIVLKGEDSRHPRPSVATD